MTEKEEEEEEEGSRQAPPQELLDAVKTEGEEAKKRLSHVGVKATQNLLSEVRKEHGGSGHLKHVAPVAKQDLLSSVRKEVGATKKRLSHVETKAVSGLMSELRNSGHHKE